VSGIFRFPLALPIAWGEGIEIGVFHLPEYNGAVGIVVLYSAVLSVICCFWVTTHEQILVFSFGHLSHSCSGLAIAIPNRWCRMSTFSTRTCPGSISGLVFCRMSPSPTFGYHVL
jgi:hypothetical protein